MERKWHKEVDGKLVEAPQSITTENGIMYNYNCEANEEMLRRDGYIPEDEKG